MDRHRLEDFKLQWNHYSRDLLLLFEGHPDYKSIISCAFSDLYFSRTFEDRSNEYDWGVYIKHATEDDADAIDRFCRKLQDWIFIVDDLTESFALDFHTYLSAEDRYKRTSMGQLVRDAKPYDTGWHQGNKKKANELAEIFVDFFQEHPTYNSADYLVAVPPSNPNKLFDLPTYLVEQIAQKTNPQNAMANISKVRNTRPMKDCQTRLEKIDNIKDAFAIEDAALFRNRSVVIVDDIYQTGFSINELGRTLFNAGAKRVLGLTATKTSQDLD